MINIVFNDKVKKLGAKWDAIEKKWVAPALARAEFEELERQYFSDLVTIDAKLNQENYGEFEGQDWANAHARTIGGYLLASAKGRDAGAKVADNVSVLAGGFRSGGSAKNFMCIASSNTCVRLQVSRYVLNNEILKNQDYIVTVLEQEQDKDGLMAEKEKLLARLAEIESILEKN